MIYDIAIIGLGPAGATLARLLSPKFKVIALDRKSGSGDLSFCKPCGGLLAPDAQKALSVLNLTLPKDILVDPQIFSVKTIDLKQSLTRYYKRFYINLDRNKFDRWLISLIPNSVMVESGARCKSIHKTDDRYEITYQTQDAERTITAKYVVGADGANSAVRRNLFPKRKIRQYVAIQEWFNEEHSLPFYSCVFDREITDSYCWSVSKDGYFILGGAFPRKNRKERMRLLKERLKAHGFIFGEPVKTEACLVSRPRGRRDFCIADDRAFLIGEAAGFISPSSLEGISYALNSAVCLAGVLNAGHKNPAKKYRKKTFLIRAKLFRKKVKSPFMYNRFLRKVIMKTGIGAIKPIDPKGTV